MERRTKRLAAGLTATAVVAGALAWGGVTVASAGTTPAAAVAAATAGPATTAQEAASTAAVRRLAHVGNLIVKTSATYDGLTPAQVRADLKAGKSLAAIAVSKGKSVSGLESTLETALVNRIDDSKLSAARKALLVSDVKTYLDAFVNATHPFAGIDAALGKHGRAHARASATPTPTASASASTAAA
jgi:hypothetical protein